MSWPGIRRSRPKVGLVTDCMGGSDYCDGPAVSAQHQAEVRHQNPMVELRGATPNEALVKPLEREVCPRISRMAHLRTAMQTDLQSHIKPRVFVHTSALGTPIA